MTRHQRDFIVVILILGLFPALWLAYVRVVGESDNPRVALCLDYAEVARLAALTDRSPEALLAELKKAGATHIALAETTLADLMLSDRISVTHSFGRTSIFGLGRTGYADALRAKLPGMAEHRQPAGPGAVAAPEIFGGSAGFFDGDVTIFSPIGVGYDPIALYTIKGSGLQLVARPVPDYCLTKQAVDYSLKAAADAGARTVVFNGTKVLGTRGLLDYTAESLTRNGLTFGMIELVPQDGEYTLASALDGHVVRCHSVSAEEMDQLSPQRAFDRFLLAVTERKVRLCYVRLFFTGSDDLGESNIGYVRDIATRLQELGYALGEPQNFDDVAPPSALLILIALGVLGGLLWMMQSLKELPARIFWFVAGVGLLLALVVPVAASGLARPLIALAAALVFPVLAVSLIAPGYPEPDPTRRGVKALRGAGLVARTSLITAVGGLLCAAALTQTTYLMSIEQFRGVKLAQILPVIAIFLIAAARATDSYRKTAESRPRWQALKAGLAEVGAAVVKYWHVAVIVLVFGALGYMLMRSGNEPAVGATDLEMRVRAVLDRLLVVRPRTKEIFLGYPALFVGIMLLLQRRRKLAWPFLAIGAVSQVSLLNTFCHMHTPLVVSLVRVFHGLWLGVLMGAVWWAVKRLADAYWAWVNSLEAEG